MHKLTIAVIFGGQSSEHEVSCMSAANIIASLDQQKYEILPVGITKEGNWRIYHGPIEYIKSSNWEPFSVDAALSPDASKSCLLKFVNGKYKEIPIDVIFPVLHGAWGEDGTIQGLAELSQIPYVGCGVLASAVSMDKVYTKMIAKSMRIPMAKYIWCDGRTLDAEKEKIMDHVEKKLGYPCFIKPSNAGSSVGISKAKNRNELEKALYYAAQYDRKVIVEEAIEGRELECAVLGNHEIRVSGVGEILSAAEFYDYDAKYNNADSRTIVPAQLDEKTVESIRKIAAKVFHAVDASGMARVDFFVEKESGRVLFNELNTIPGFTSVSMYPMLWEERGMTKTELMDCLITLALERDNGIRA